MKCSCCGRDINAIGQDNVSYDSSHPLCEDCGSSNSNYGEQNYHQQSVSQMPGNGYNTVIMIEGKEIHSCSNINWSIMRENELLVFQCEKCEVNLDEENFNFESFYKNYRKAIDNISFGYTNNLIIEITEKVQKKCGIYSFEAYKNICVYSM